MRCAYVHAGGPLKKWHADAHSGELCVYVLKGAV